MHSLLGWKSQIPAGFNDSHHVKLTVLLTEYSMSVIFGDNGIVLCVNHIIIMSSCATNNNCKLMLFYL